MHARCPVAAEVAPTPIMPRAKLRACSGWPVPLVADITVAAHGIGALLTVTANRMNSEDALRGLLQSDRALRLRTIITTVDFHDKSSTSDADHARRDWTKTNLPALNQMAASLHKLSGNVPVLVELVDMHGTCMGEYLSRVMFRGYSGCGDEPSACHTARFWKNTIAFSWGLARAALCARYVVHVDNDIRLLVRPPTRLPQLGAANTTWSPSAAAVQSSWVRRAVSVLQGSSSVLSVHPLRGPAHVCSRNAQRCTCRIGRDRTSGGLHVTRVTTLLLGDVAAPACLLTYEGPHKPGVPHFSIQAFVVDLQRFQHVWPLSPSLYRSYGPYDSNSSSEQAARADRLRQHEVRRGIFRDQGHVDPESMFEENAMRAGLEIVHMMSTDLGVEKAVTRG